MRDELLKAICCDGRVRILINDTTHLCEEARQKHDMWPTSMAALGRVMSIGSIMGAMQKNEKEKVTIQINGGGPIGTIMVDCFPSGYVRGFASDPYQYITYNDTGKLAVGVAVGKEGYLRVIKDLGLKDDFTGTVQLQTGEIGDDFAYYFAASEQTPSVVSVGVLVDTDNSVIAAGGLLIQMMPDALEEDYDKIENITAKLRPMTEMIHKGMDCEAILKEYFDDVVILERREIGFECHCSKDTMIDAISTIGKDELHTIIEEDHGCEVTCQWCNTHYEFNEDELRAIEAKL